MIISTGFVGGTLNNAAGLWLILLYDIYKSTIYRTLMNFHNTDFLQHIKI